MITRDHKTGMRKYSSRKNVRFFRKYIIRYKTKQIFRGGGESMLNSGNAVKFSVSRLPFKQIQGVIK